MRWLLALLLLVACSSAEATPAGEAPDGPSSGTVDPGPGSTGGEPPAPAPADRPACAGEVTDGAAVPIGAATEAGEHALVIEASSVSDTSWAEKDNEAVVLEVLRGTERIGHLVLHQGSERFAYGMHVGTLATGDALSVRVSPLTAKKAERRACLAKVTLAKSDSEGVAHAPILKWPVKKTFDDLPVLVGWSKKGQGYQVTYTNENGGTVALCGGGAEGIRSEIARWGRALDMEGAFSYGGPGRFGRCTGSTTLAPGMPRMETLHPVLYYGDGHNRLFESRGGYGQACGTSGDNRADGDLEGWNTQNPGSEPEKDDPFTVVLRPLPVDLDAVPGRESIVDTYAPWLYRLTASELEREGKIDGKLTFPMERYLFVDVYAADVGGSGDATCSSIPLIPPRVSGGFVLRAVTKGGVVSNGPQMTADYFGGTLKRLAIPLAAGVGPSDITKLVLDAYDDDGIYWLALGDAFVARPKGRNGATLEYVHKGKTKVDVYVDDGKSGCVNDTSTRDGIVYPCVGTLHTLTL